MVWNIVGVELMLMMKAIEALKITGRIIVNKKKQLLKNLLIGYMSGGNVILKCIFTTMPIMKLLFAED